MSPITILCIILVYFAVLYVVGLITSRKATNETFFLANRRSAWYLVAYAMIGTSLSGVTFISVPGWVGTNQFSYMQMVLGYIPGYLIIAFVLLPLYYRLRLTTIYTYLLTRFGVYSYKTGAAIFILSRLIGSSFRLFLVSDILQLAVFEPLGIPFWANVSFTMLVIWLYTHKGGIKTIIWTDTIQTTFMIGSLVATLWFISREMGWTVGGLLKAVADSEYSRVFFFDNVNEKKFFVKQFLSGAFIALVMTGLDQDMMQKNLSCRTIGDAQKNMVWFSLTLVPVNLLFMMLGASLYLYAQAHGIALPVKSDNLFPMLALEGYFPPVVGFMFLIGLVAAAFSSADSTLAALTTSVVIDLQGCDPANESAMRRARLRAHWGMTLAMVAIILAFRSLHSEALINAIFTVAGYTYGPLLGLFAFALLTHRKPRERLVPYIAAFSPAAAWAISYAAGHWFGYTFGYELVALNGAICFGLLWLSRR